MKPLASWIVLRHAAYGILGAIGLSGISAGASQGIDQLLLSPADPPIRDIVISLAIVDGVPNIEPIHLRIGERGVPRLSVLIHMMIFIAKENGRYRLKREGLREINDHAGSPCVVSVGRLIELPVGDIDAPQPFLVALVGLYRGRRARASLGRVLALDPPLHVAEVRAVILVRDIDGSLLSIRDRTGGQADQQATADGRDHRTAKDHHLSRRTASPELRTRAAFGHQSEHTAGDTIPQALAR